MVTMNPDYEDRYTSAQVAAAVGLAPDTLKSWVSRQPQVILLTAEERENVGKGYRILFSFNRAMQIALTVELVLFGMQPRSAALAAAAFTDVSEGGSGWQGEPAGELRLPGQLYSEGWTYLLVPPSQSESQMTATCLNVSAETKLVDLMAGHARTSRGRGGAILLEVNAVHRRVRMALAADAS